MYEEFSELPLLNLRSVYFLIQISIFCVDNFHVMKSYMHISEHITMRLVSSVSM